ncbi:GTP-binding protein [Microbacterium sp. NPDC089189]|uniref:GTP-binding protein n=1 Tax=Microbacterium sp. NPDC089189 TaxID=3154972 RepID=UPI00343B6FFA
MPSPDIIAVMGVCAPERHAYARRLATTAARRLVIGPAGLDGSRVDRSEQLVLEAGTAESPLRIAALLESGGGGDVVCVVDAVHALDDLMRDDPADPLALARGPLAHPGSRGLQAALALEYATVVVLVNWETVPTAHLAETMALVSHLAPCARLRLSRDPALDLLGARTTEPAPTHARPGWVRALNGEHDPTMTHRNVSTLRYEQVRPFHPERLRDTLDDIDEGTYGRVVRSAGFARLATRLGIAQWDQVGSALWLNPIPADEGDPLAIGQDLALTGRGLDGDALRRALDAAALDDAEFAAGPAVWQGLADPFPAWDTVDAAAPEDDLPGGGRR